MKISDLLRHLTEIQKKVGDSYEIEDIDFGAVEDAIDKNDPFPMAIHFKPSGAKRPDEL